MRRVITLGHDDAQAAVHAMRDALLSEGRHAVVAVADVHGELLSLLRLDGAPASSARIAMHKAWTAANQRVPTRAIGARLKRTDEAFDIAYYGDVRACGWAGGLPVLADGVVVGAVAVSGLPEDEDERIARIGLAAIPGADL